MVTVCILRSILKLVEVFLFLGWFFFFFLIMLKIFLSRTVGFLLMVVVVFVSLFCQSRPFFSIVTENTQGRTENVFLTTGVFNHCSNESRQPIHSASLKMYIGIFDFFFLKEIFLLKNT